VIVIVLALTTKSSVLVGARHDPRNNPSFVLAAPLPPTTGSGEDLKPPHRFRDSTMHCPI